MLQPPAPFYTLVCGSFMFFAGRFIEVGVGTMLVPGVPSSWRDFAQEA